MIYILIVFLLLIILTIVAHSNDVKIISLREGKIEFWKPREERDLLFYPCFSIDPVISKDGEIYKIHVMISILLVRDMDITNWTFKIHRLRSMVFKQYFYQDELNNRNPLGKLLKLPIQLNESFVTGLEFEPEKDYTPLTFYKRVYKAKLTCKTPRSNQKLKFKFRVRERNLKALEIVKEEAIKDNQPKVISFPIIH